MNEKSLHGILGSRSRTAAIGRRTRLHRIAIWHRLHTLLLWFFILGFAPSLYAAETLRVLTVLSDSSPLYQDFAKALTQNLPNNIQMSVLQHPDDFNGDASDAELIVTVGLKAAETVAGMTRLPMLAAVIPNNKYVSLLSKRDRTSQFSAVYVDQPWFRQIALIRAVMPERTRIGLLYSRDGQLDLDELRREAKRQHQTLVEMPTKNEGDLFNNMVGLLPRSDVLLALPDSKIFNSNTIRNILLESYRHNVPLVGIGQSYVNAGALCAVYSTPEQLATQAEAMVNRFAQSRHLSEAQFPMLYNVAINQEVMRTLGINIRSPEWLHLQIDKMQGGRQ